MSIIATIKRPSLIVANTAGVAKSQSQNPIELKNNISQVSQNYLDKLLDVEKVNPVTGATLVYNAQTDKYEIKIADIPTDLDGGTF